ncbi:MAG: NADH-quinone oxidoreductase subunit C [Anaerolineae bacterium]
MSAERAAAAADIEALAERLGPGAVADVSHRGHAAAIVDRARLLEAATALRDELGYQLLRSVTALDLAPARPRFQAVYHFAALPAHVVDGDPVPRPNDPARELRIKVPLEDDDLRIDSLTAVYPTANFHERETYDMFGVQFDGHPDLRRILLPDDFDGHPLRKDHPLVYEPVAFTHNEAAIALRKPLARE